MTYDELDRMIAEKVMGWTLGKVEDDRHDYWLEDDMIHGWPDGYEAWRPSRSLMDAWQVVKHIQSKPMGPANNYPNFGILDESTPTRGFVWVYFDGYVNDEKYGGTNTTERHESYANALPTAICFAALRVVGALPKWGGRILDGCIEEKPEVPA